MVIEYLNKEGLNALWEKIKLNFAKITEVGELESTLSSRISSIGIKVGSLEGTVAGVYNRGEYNKGELQANIDALEARVNSLEARVAALESKGGDTPVPVEHGVVNADNNIIVNDTYTSIKYVDDSNVEISGVINID